jgi:thiol-disulfide isomerase/thioredoxin/tRNA A-37 threonylcarbamoyl transferase component Bud32
MPAAAAPGNGPTIDFQTPPPASQAETMDRIAGPVAAQLPFRREFGDYELLEEVARGGMGVVFKARQRHPQRVVALKMILAGQFASAENVRRFLIEAEEAGQLDHPNIVPIYQVGECDGQHFFTMRLMTGGNLAQQVSRIAKKDPQRAARIISTVARAVHYAHQHGILHRDLKPGNILLDTDGEPHVTDFGVAKHMGTEGANTQSGAIVGTPAYMAPEQAQGKKDLTVAADVYGLGAILFELLTGRPPFQADTPVDCILHVVHDDPPSPRSFHGRLDRDLETICLKCLAKDPSRRYASAAALAEDLDRYLAGEPIQARPIGRGERLMKWVKRRPALATLAAATAAALLVLLCGGWIYGTLLHAAYNDVEKKRTEAYQNWQTVQRQKDEILTSYQKRVQLVDDTIQKFDGRLARMERLLLADGQAQSARQARQVQSVRIEFLSEVIDLCRGLLQEKPGDVAVQRQLAKVYVEKGDLEVQLARRKNAAEDYERALGLMTPLAQQTDDQADRSEVARIRARSAGLLYRDNRYDEARQAYEEVISMEDGLARAFPEKAGDAQLQSATALFQIANIQEDQRRTDQAEKIYQQVLDQQQELAERDPRNAAVQRLLARAAFSLASLQAKKDPAASRRCQELSHRAWETAYGLAPLSAETKRGYAMSFSDLKNCYKEQGSHAEMLALGRAQAAAGLDEPRDNYNAACIIAEAAGSAPLQSALPEAERARLAESYGSEAVQFLRKAFECGYKNRDLLDSDPDLDPLRHRADFLDLMADLDTKLPAGPKTPAREFERITTDYTNKLTAYQGDLSRARSVAERRRAVRKMPQLEPVARQLLELARQHADADAAVDALTWIVRQTGPGKDGRQAASQRQFQEEALRVLERDHLTKPGMTWVCQLLAEQPSPAGDRLLAALMEKHPDRDVRGLAGYALAKSLDGQWTLASTADPDKAAALSRRADEQYQRVIKEYGEVAYGRSKLGATAKADRQRFLYLKVGRPAREIEGEDVAGESLKLSDHRGKVVVVSFWANWCGYCRQLYPHENELVQRYKDRPFALLGINCDEDRTEVAQVQKRVGITWRSWWSRAGKNGEIRSEWLVDAFPTVYVLDHNGVIRYSYRGVPGPELDTAVETLLAEVLAK